MNESDLNGEYAEVERRFFHSILGKLDQQLKLYCITGSVGRKKALLGWSDIDILLVIDRYDAACFATVGQAIADCNSTLKIGVTLFSIEEFNCGSLKNSRTLLAVNAILDNRLSPRVRAPEVRITPVPTALIKQTNRAEFARVLHDLKRELLRLDEYDERKAYKFLVILLKIVLQERDITVDSYDGVLEHASSLSYLAPDLPSPAFILATPERKSERFAYYMEFLERVRAHSSEIFT